MSRADVAPEAAKLARELRRKRRTRAGRRWLSWETIAAEVERQGLGRFAPRDLAEAVSLLPAEGHPLAPRSPDEMARLEASWRQGWAAEFPGEEWPGLDEARRRIRGKAGL